jgi:hypothetical protein
MSTVIEKTEGDNREKWIVPLSSPFYDKNNVWIIEHLRSLADRIEKTNPYINSIELTSKDENNVVCLELEVYL